MARGPRAIDIDVEDVRLVADIVGILFQYLPQLQTNGSLVRRRDGTPRLIIVARAATGQPPKISRERN